MPQVIAPLIAPILGVAATSTVAVVAANVITLAGITAAQYLVAKAQQPEEKRAPGTKLKSASGGAVPLSLIFGEKESAGSLLYHGTWGKDGKVPNAYYVRVYCLADLPVTSFSERVWVGGKKGTIDFSETSYTAGDDATSGTSMGNPVTSQDHDDRHYMWIKFLDGNQTVADPYLREVFGGLASRPWTTSMIGRGRPLMIVTQRYTQKEANEVPEVVPVVGGHALYDWRRDSTNGGSGAQRWNDPTTWAFTKNPIVIAYNVMRGIYRGSTWLYGGQNWPARRFDNDTWTAAANACDENVSLAGGGTEKRYEIGGEIEVSEEPLDVIDRILSSCAGRLVESGGVYKVYVGGIGASVLSFNDADIVITESLTGKMFPRREDICNTIVGTYVEPNNAGQDKAYGKRSIASFIDEDGGEERPKDMSFDMVRSNTQAQRLARHALIDNRRFMTKIVSFSSLARKLEPGDVVNWNSDRFGFVNKKFIVGDVTLSDYGIVICVLREVDATDADWSTGDETPYTVGVYGDVVPVTQTFTPNVSAIAITNNAGTARRPGIRIGKTLDADDMADARALKWQVRLKDTQELVASGRSDDFFDEEGASQIRIGSTAFLPGEDYQVRCRLIPYSDRPTAWSAWSDGNVTLMTVRFLRADIEDGAIGDDQTDQSVPTTPGAPTVTSPWAADVDEDGTIDPAIRVVVTQPSGIKVRRYRIEVSRSATIGGTYTAWKTFGFEADDPNTAGTTTSYDFKANANKYHKVRVRSVSFNGVKSDFGPQNATGVKPQVYVNTMPTVQWKGTNPTIARAQRNILRYQQIDQTLRHAKEIVIYRNTVNNSATATEIDTAPVNSTQYVDADDITPGTTYYYWLKARDKAGQVSPSFSAVQSAVFRVIIRADIAAAAISATETDSTPAAVPPAVSISQFAKDLNGDGTVDIGLKITYTVPSDAVGCVLQINDGTETWYEYPKKSPFRMAAIVGKTYSVKVASVSFNGTESAFNATATTFTPTGKTGLPTAPSGVVAAGELYSVTVSWNAPTDKDYYYTELYESYINTAPVSGTVPSATTVGKIITYYIPRPGFPLSYTWVRHVNSSGVKSNWVAAGGVVINLIDEDYIEWGGVSNDSLADGSVSTAKIAANAVTSPSNSSSNSATAVAAGATVTVESVSPVDVTDTRYILVMGAFRNEGGTGAHLVDVTIDDSAADFSFTLPNMQLTGNEYGFVSWSFPTVSLTGNINVRMRVTNNDATDMNCTNTRLTVWKMRR